MSNAASPNEVGDLLDVLVDVQERLDELGDHIDGILEEGDDVPSMYAQCLTTKLRQFLSALSDIQDLHEL